jgi:saccharopine dehydrogenase-like NADP-dependent oxidoreductase
MPNITIFGAGKSATICIAYLAQKALSGSFTLTVVDMSADLLHEKTKTFPHVQTSIIAIENDLARTQIVSQANIIISLLPPHLHIKLAKDCLQYNKHLITASYADEAMKLLHEEAVNKNLLFLCEMGLDPGLDHMSAMKLIDGIHHEGGVIMHFESHCGGLVAPESDTNPWHYKISWNPKNVVLAGRAGATYLQYGQPKTIPYQQVFLNAKTITTLDNHVYAWYPNRNSFPYIDLYKLTHCDTFIRTTLRHPDFLTAWNILVQENATDENNTESSLLFFEQLAKKYASNTAIKFLLDDMHNIQLPTTSFSKAFVLQQLLEKKLALALNDKDLVVMQHDITYTDKNGIAKQVKSFLTITGENQHSTAMAKTVGLPLALGALAVLNNTVNMVGVHIPIHANIYNPLLAALAKEGIVFIEKEQLL